MLIHKGLKHKKWFGFKLRAKGPDFHQQFGSTIILPGDFNLDANLYPAFDQNNPNPLFGTPAQPNGCTGMATAGVMTDVLKLPVSPWYSYKQACLAEGVSTNSPLEMAYALNEPVISGLQVLGETETQALGRKTPPWWEVKPLDGSMFMGLVSAMVVGGAPISFAGIYYESYDNPVQGILSTGTGQSDGHDFEVCGLKRVNGVPYLIATLWLGANWGGGNGLRGGYCLISEAEINAQDGQGFTPKESPDASLPAPITTENILESLLHFWQTLLKGYGSTTPVFTRWEEMEEELQTLEQKLYTMEDNVYTKAKASLGKHMTLNEAVPAEKGCAETVSAVLALAGISDGSGGIAGTASLYEWLVASPHFVKIDAPEAGAIICSPTGQGNGSIEGHVGFFGQFNTAFPNDWGIMSNDSASGLFMELWNWTRWSAYYGVAGGLPLAMFRPI